MPVISSRRYSSYLTTPSVTSTTSSSLSSSTSGVGSYRSSNYSSSSTSTLPLSTSRYNYGNNDTYRSPSSYRSPLSSSTLSSSDRSSGSTYRSRYDFDENNNSKRSTASDSLSTRIGVSSKNDSRSSRIFDTLPPLPPSSSSNVPSSSYLSKRALSRSRDIGASDSSNGKSESNDSNGGGKLSLMDDLEFYEKYSPSRYLTKFETARARSQSEATITTPSRDSSSPSSSMKSLNVTSPTSTPKSEVNACYLYQLQVNCVMQLYEF